MMIMKIIKIYENKLLQLCYLFILCSIIYFTYLHLCSIIYFTHNYVQLFILFFYVHFIHILHTCVVLRITLYKLFNTQPITCIKLVHLYVVGYSKWCYIRQWLWISKTFRRFNKNPSCWRQFLILCNNIYISKN